jgi:hypothetical protein
MITSVRSYLFAALIAAAALLSLTTTGLVAPAVSHADPGCTDVPYYGCIFIPNAQIPATPGVPADIPVPAWTPSLDLCQQLGHRFTVGNICI